MAEIEVEETMAASDISEGYGSSDEGSADEALLSEPVRGVRDGALPPFVNNLYNVVSNKDTDSIISWVPNPNLAQSGNHVSGCATSFVIWNYNGFINNVLPVMSRSKKFNSFITQLKNYGFKKISCGRHEYTNEWFQEGKPHLLKKIKRIRKPTKSESKKLQREISTLETISKELDNELYTFKEYVEGTMSDQKNIVQAIARSIKATISHHHHVCENSGVISRDNATQNKQ